MKYEYHDLISITLIEKAKDIIDKDTISKGEIKIGEILNGICEFKNKGADQIHIIVTYGTVIGICDKKGSDLSIDFTIYEFLYPMGLENQLVCNMKIT